MVRKKSDVAGVWVNTSSITFASVPSYYAIASTKPIEQIAGPARAGAARHRLPAHQDDAVAGLARRFQGLRARRLPRRRHSPEEDSRTFTSSSRTAWTFTGRSLFRSTIALPANVPVGPLVARTYLFRNGEVVSAHIARVTLQRAGIERLVHNFAFVYPMSYGLIAVLIAVISGLLASAYFRRQPG